MKIKILILIVLAFGFYTCSNDDDRSDTCDQVALVSSTDYATAPNAPLVINNLEINGNCLKINFSASGCSVDN